MIEIWLNSIENRLKQIHLYVFNNIKTISPRSFKISNFEKWMSILMNKRSG